MKSVKSTVKAYEREFLSTTLSISTSAKYSNTVADLTSRNSLSAQRNYLHPCSESSFSPFQTRNLILGSSTTGNESMELPHPHIIILNRQTESRCLSEPEAHCLTKDHSWTCIPLLRMAIHSFHSEQEMEEKKQQEDRLHIRRYIHTVKLLTRCHSQFKQHTRTTCLNRPRSVLACRQCDPVTYSFSPYGHIDDQSRQRELSHPFACEYYFEQPLRGGGGVGVTGESSPRLNASSSSYKTSNQTDYSHRNSLVTWSNNGLYEPFNW